MKSKKLNAENKFLSVKSDEVKSGLGIFLLLNKPHLYLCCSIPDMFRFVCSTVNVCVALDSGDVFERCVIVLFIIHAI